MSTSNLGEDRSEASPSNIIIQLAETIKELYYKDNYINK